ncbi:hypothetical protein FEE96_16895 [Parasedimentitalea maritima]|uniref:DUF4142 domain-containing protein n=1 Tax=Parasedimentitalea maritima TaxID=2578117 RepID=A0ABY2URR7_9RHOB|nr:hypothetical protein [Zongyanglinia marina]TLP59281.1 hypothetical protein FEE96_16895 [Zongyanglinia marina]
MFTTVFRFLLIAALATAQPVIAGEGGGNEGGDRGGGFSTSTLNGSATSRVVDILTRGFGKCKRLPKIYRYDCYWKTYKKAQDFLHGSLVYSQAHKAISEVEDTLRLVVRNNVDPSKKPVRRGLNTYRAINEAAIPEAKARTERAMDQAQTILLRAPDNKQAHFARIADAVNSNKVLLRSALLPGGLLRFAWYLMQLRSA